MVNSLSEKDLQHIAQLARLRLEDEASEELRRDISRILQYVEKLQEVDLENVAPLSHVHGAVNALRDDAAEPFGEAERILKEAPQEAERHIVVPFVLAEPEKK